MSAPIKFLPKTSSDASERAFKKFLPQRKRSIIEIGQDEADALEGMRQGLGTKETGLQRRKDELSRKLAEYDDEIERGATTANAQSDAMLAEIRDELKDVDKQLARIRASKTKDKPMCCNITFYNNEFLPDAITKQWMLVEQPALTLKKGETPKGKLAEIRGAIVDAKAEKIATTKVEVADEDARAAVVAEVEKTAAKGAVSLSQVYSVRRRGSSSSLAALSNSLPKETQGKIGWPTRLDDALNEQPMTFEVMHFLFKDQIIARLFDEMDRRPKNPNAMTISERAAHLDELDERIFQLGLLEELVVEMIEDDGGSCPRRSDADFCCILGIRESGARVPTIKPKSNSEVEHYDPHAAKTVFKAS